MTKLHDLTGQRFGRLVVRGRAPSRNKYGDAYWLCQCDCGGNKEASTHSLRRGKAPSCGCLRMSNRCSVEGCDTTALCKGMCNKHYQRAYRQNGDTSDRPRTRLSACNIDGCNAKAVSKGLCAKHYQRARRGNGNASIKPRIVRTCNVEGCDAKAIKHRLCNKHYIRVRISVMKPTRFGA
jgi:hypothetical protein